ncbi:Ribosomal RNA adenine dimethylase [Symmachiella dynata]|uniref:16S rRNA (adenine(1518)-N(6)/adenine(1519)-N(6))- dimethyltransferase RsmA n=1 Tax=Symmachiella dynata TaxID=2527995 RepID=UPI00118BEB41|nr:16S rRNA (adenine(1518)-N(6)/adenine(1519)-N(6))-dimethyltransferase RsmA [Symmachiella dynata]QDT47542.1 Ribosomal RNA adenine dimethylase [Symmachiella dynata]
MSEAERQTQSHLRDLFDSRGISPRKILGQNFLIDLNLVEYIVEQARLTPDDLVLEIGSGTGSMTAMLAAEAGDVISVEVDPVMHKLASEAVMMFDNVTLLNCDALKNKNTFAPEVLAAIAEKLEERPGRKLKLVANLPYVIATPVVSNLVKTELPWSAIIVTIQWELGQRMGARVGSSHYGALSVWLQAQARVKTLKRLRPSVFWPRPKVTSAIVRLLPDAKLKKRILDRDFFQDFVRRLFHHRRKLLRSVLVGMYRKQFSKPDIDAILAPFQFKETARAEELDVKTLVDLAAAFRAALDVPARIAADPT